MTVQFPSFEARIEVTLGLLFRRSDKMVKEAEIFSHNINIPSSETEFGIAFSLCKKDN